MDQHCPSRRHPIKNERNCKAIIIQIIMSFVYINVMACQTIQKGYDPILITKIFYL